MKLISLFIFLFFLSFSHSQSINGLIIDSLSNKPIPFARVGFIKNNNYTNSDFKGQITIDKPSKIDTIIISSLGYETSRIIFNPNVFQTNDTIVFYLTPKTLKQVEISKKYKNPVFRILKEIHANENFNNPEKLNDFEFEVYNTLQFNITNITDKFEDRKLIKNFDFIVNYMDTVNGKNYLPALFTESASTYYFNKLPHQKKEIVKATRVTGVKNLQLERYTGEIHQNFNIYDNFIDVFNTDFMSPIALGARTLYEYKLLGIDTINNTPSYHIKFIPRRVGEAAFIGEFWINKSTYAIMKVIAEIPKNINLNYVSYFRINQTYSQIDNKASFVTEESIEIRFKVFNDTKKALLMGLTVLKNTSRTNIIINQKRPISFYIDDIIISDTSKIRNNEYWETVRHDSLNSEEAGIIEMNDSLENNKLFKFYKKFAYFSYTGYWQAGPIEIGNIYSIYQNNAVEGDRIMLSLRTSNAFSKWHEISTFGIYGFKDQQYKYGLSYRWKFKHKNREILRFAYKKRIEQLSLSSSLGDVGNSFSTLFSGGLLDKLTLIDQYAINFEKDWSIDMRTFNAIEWKRYTSLPGSDYQKLINGDTTDISQITSFQFRNQIMYTKDEKFISGSFERFSLGSKSPIISLTHTLGLNNILNSQYYFNRFDLVLDHRPKVGVFGRIQYSIYAGQIFGTLPYPFLNVHQGNETFYIQSSSMNLMNYYEFISDQWIGANFEHQLQGFILDKIPLVRKLKWRLLYGGKIVFGKLKVKHESEMLIPTYSHQLSYTKPYSEVHLGVENILKFIRVDAIWRLSYLNHEDITNFGVKFTFTGDF